MSNDHSANFNYLFFLYFLNFSFDPSCCDIVRDATTAGIFSTPHCSLSLLSSTPIQLAATPAFHPTFLLANSPFLFFDLMSIVLSLLFTCWLHLLPAVHSLPCLRLLRSCWWLPTTYPGLACDTLQFHCYVLPHRSQQHTLNTTVFLVSLVQFFFHFHVHHFVLQTACFGIDVHFSVQHPILRRRSTRPWCFDGPGIVIVPTALLVPCLRHMPPTMGVACVSCAFSRLRNASRCAVTFCVPEKVANACSPCSTSIHPCTILPSLPGIGSAPFSIVNDGRHITIKSERNFILRFFCFQVLCSPRCLSHRYLQAALRRPVVEQLFRLFASFPFPIQKKKCRCRYCTSQYVSIPTEDPFQRTVELSFEVLRSLLGCFVRGSWSSCLSL